MPKNKDVSLLPTTRGSSKPGSQLRPTGLFPSAYPTRPDGSGAPTRTQKSMIQTRLHTANPGTDGTASPITAIPNESRITTAQTLLQKLDDLYWEEDKLTNLYNRYGSTAGAKTKDAETRREEVSKLIEGFCVYDEHSSINKGRSEAGRGQAEEDWNTAAEAFLIAQEQVLK